MSLCFGIKTLCDLSLYFIYAQLVCAGFGVSFDVRAPLALLAAAGGLCCALRERGWLRFAPLAAVPLCLFWLPGLAGALTLVAPAAYLGVTAGRRLFQIGHSECCDGFRRGALLLLPLLALPILGAGELTARVALPLAVLYLACGVLLLRMLRHEPAVLSQPRFVLLNSAVLALVLGAAALLSSPAALSALKSGMGWVYQHIVVPPLMLLGYLAAGLMWVLMRLLSQFDRSGSEMPPQDGEMDLQDTPLFDDIELVQTPDFLKALATTLFIALCIFIAWRVLRKMLGRRAGPRTGPAVIETRGAAGQSLRPEHTPRFRPRDPRAAVRWHYGRFLLLCRRLGIALTHDATSETLAGWSKQVLPARPVDRLRELYLTARYSEQEITRQMADEAHEAVREMKKQMPNGL